MARCERLKACRALSTDLQPRRLKLVTELPDPRELPTDPVGSAPPESGQHAPLHAIPPNAAPAPQPDRNNFEHWALEELLSRARKLDEQQKNLDIGGELERFAKRLEKSFDANFGMLHSALDAQAKRIAASESAIDLLRADMRREIAELRTKLGELEARVNDAAEAAPSPTG